MGAVSGTPSTVKITPDRGTRRFRRACSLAVEDGVLVATDRKGTTRRFPLNQDLTSPAASVMISATPFGAFRDQSTIIDGNGEVLVLTYVGDWDTIEWGELEQAAGLTKDVEYHAEPKTQLRQDGLVLEDGTWWRWAPQAGTLAFVVAMVGGVGGAPGVLAWIVVLGLVVYLVLALTSGAYGKGRRGKGAAEAEALMAGDEAAWKDLIRDVAGPLPEEQLEAMAAGDDEAWDKAIKEAEEAAEAAKAAETAKAEEATKPLRERKTDPPEAAT
jgi:hypothetical protein